ncbi:hypothetical protein DSUL_260033 [Desulfovibrionales bacterium]
MLVGIEFMHILKRITTTFKVIFFIETVLYDVIFLKLDLFKDVSNLKLRA